MRIRRASVGMAALPALCAIARVIADPGRPRQALSLRESGAKRQFAPSGQTARVPPLQCRFYLASGM